MVEKETLREQLIRHEGLRLKPYRCTAGKLTIGIGRNLDDVGISEGEAYIMLDNDINATKSDLDVALPWWREMPREVQNVMVNMCFNMGLTRFLGFKKTLFCLQCHNWQEAADEMLDSKWAEQVGNRAKELAKIVRSVQV
jgi:lysozyme